MLNFHHKESQDRPVEPYWQSVGDVMAGILIVFILFFVIKINAENKTRRIFDELHQKRTEIISELRKEFKDHKRITILEDGTVRFNIGTEESRALIDDKGELDSWFKKGDWILGNTAAKELQQFIPSYLDILLAEKNRNYIDEIIIEGHTDSSGQKGVNSTNENYLYNLRLSQSRAFSVSQYVHGMDRLSAESHNNDVYRNILRRKMAANGRSYSDLYYEPIFASDFKDIAEKYNLQVKYILNELVNTGYLQDALQITEKYTHDIKKLDIVWENQILHDQIIKVMGQQLQAKKTLQKQDFNLIEKNNSIDKGQISDHLINQGYLTLELKITEKFKDEKTVSKLSWNVTGNLSADDINIAIVQILNAKENEKLSRRVEIKFRLPIEKRYESEFGKRI